MLMVINPCNIIPLLRLKFSLGKGLGVICFANFHLQATVASDARVEVWRENSLVVLVVIKLDSIRHRPFLQACIWCWEYGLEIETILTQGGCIEHTVNSEYLSCTGS